MQAQAGPSVGQVVGVGLGADIPVVAVVSPLDGPHQVHHALQARLAEGDVLDDCQTGPSQVLQSNYQSDDEDAGGVWVWFYLQPQQEIILARSDGIVVMH